MNGEGMRVFGGSASVNLVQAICGHLGMPPGAGEVHRFPDGNLLVRIKENVRGRDVYILQSTAYPANDNLMELLFWIDAFKRASASSVTAVVPYFSYAKGDKKDEPRVSIRARVVADAIEAAGADRLLTLDLHAAQIQGFFRIPVDDLYAWPTLCKAIQALGLGDIVVVSPDVGFAKKAQQYAANLGAPLAIAHKRRLDHFGGMVIGDIIGLPECRRAIIVDDFTVSGATLAAVAEQLARRGVEVYAAVTHGMFNEECAAVLETSPIQKLLVTDSIDQHALPPKVRVVSVAPLFAEAIRRIQAHESISVLFPTS